MGAYEYNVVAPAVSNTVSRVDEVISLPEMAGNIELSLSLQQIVAWRAPIHKYIKIRVDFGDESDDLTINEPSGFDEKNKKLTINHKFLARRSHRTLFYIKVFALKDDLVFDKFTIVLKLRNWMKK